MTSALIALMVPLLLLGTRRSQPESTAAEPRMATTESSAATARADTDTLSLCADDFLRPFQEFTGSKRSAHGGAVQLASTSALASPGGPPPGATGSWSAFTEDVQSAADTALQGMGGSTALGGLEAVVAMLPDPLDSGLGYAFDSQLQGLVLGLEADVVDAVPSSPGFHRDRGWLPWTASSQDSKGVFVLDRQECRRELPGVLLFRGAEPTQPRLLVLLLVGESPIVGVHVTAMSRALELARQLNGRALEAAPEGSLAASVRVLGPSYSGSAPSLRRVLDQHPDLAVSFVSGSANGPDVSRILGAEDSPLGRKTWRAGTSYRATTVPQHALECSFLHYAEHAGADHDEVGGPYAVPVDGVAILRESGTEFGGGDAPDELPRSQIACGLRPEILLSFPFHVSAIRDAYEALDVKPELRTALDPMLARHTSLDISLPGTQRTDMEMPSSPVTKYAQDLALGHVLGEIEREGVRWVGIQATDIADSIFLARKIRDVAPDVRIAFFGSDALLSHPAYRRDLIGSLMVTPYPFLGSDHFRSQAPQPDRPRIVAHPHASFANAESEGVYNAALVLRGARRERLAEYAFIRPEVERAHDALAQPLPVWIATLGRSGIIPMQARPALDCHHTIFGSDHGASRDLCSDDPSPEAWDEFNQLRSLELHLDPDVMPPRFMHLVLALLLLGFYLHHQLVHRRHLETLDESDFPTQLEPDDALLDRCIVRTKWRLYAAFARVTHWLAISYLALIYLLGAWVYFQHDQGPRLLLPLGLAAIASASLFAFCVREDVRALLHDAAQFRAFLHRRKVMTWAQAPHPRLLVGDGLKRDLAWVALSLGMAEPRVRDEEHDRLLFVSFAQLRTLLILGATVIAVFCVATVWTMWSSTDVALDEGLVPSAMTLFALRHVPFTNGVSASAPILLSLVCVYLWALGRMKRLLLLHNLSACTDRDGMLDGVSTPIRSILYPDKVGAAPDTPTGDAGFTAVERSLVNAVLRPSGIVYFAALAVIAVVPAVLYVVMRPTTLETAEVTRVLYGVLGSCAMLTCATLVQLFLYRGALCQMLDRIMAHPLGASFQFVAPPLRESLDAQLSRTHAPEIRLAVCEQSFQYLSKLRAMSSRSDDADPRPSLLVEALANHSVQLAALRARAFGEQPHDVTSHAGRGRVHRSGKDGTAIALLGRELVGAARTVTRLLEHEWRQRPPPAWSARKADEKSARNQQPLGTWYREAEAYVASVVSVLLNQHVRQFRHFLVTTTLWSLVLLLAVTSYPFEPHRALMTGLWILIMAVVIGSLAVFLSLDRAPLLNFIAGEPEQAGKVTWNFDLVRRVFFWVLVPILVVLATQYPDVARELAKLAEPFTFKL